MDFRNWLLLLFCFTFFATFHLFSTCSTLLYLVLTSLFFASFSETHPRHKSLSSLYCIFTSPLPYCHTHFVHTRAALHFSLWLVMLAPVTLNLFMSKAEKKKLGSDRWNQTHLLLGLHTSPPLCFSVTLSLMQYYCHNLVLLTFVSSDLQIRLFYVHKWKWFYYTEQFIQYSNTCMKYYLQ